MKLPAWCHRASLWGALFSVWLIALWVLSSRPMQGTQPMGLPIDKVWHFGYFFGGGGLLTAVLFLQKGRNLPWSTIHLIVLIALFAVGSLDEWHQSWYPFRSGNDAADLTADSLGALAGTLVFRKLQPVLFPKRA